MRALELRQLRHENVMRALVIYAVFLKVLTVAL